MNYRELITYYNLELDYLRRVGAEFARKFPRVAQRLELQSTESPDPHVERLIESFAFLTARVHRKIDDDFSEFSQALIERLFPQYLAPVPSLCITRFEVDFAQNRAADGMKVPRHTALVSPPIAGARCHFRTCYDLTLWPVMVSSVHHGGPELELDPPRTARSAIRLRLQTPPKLKFSDLEIPSLRFFLHGSERQANALYDHILDRVSRVDFVLPGDKPRVIARIAAGDILTSVGCEPEEALFPGGAGQYGGHRLLLELFAFPQKFLFFDLNGLAGVVPLASGQVLDVIFYADEPLPPEAGRIDESSFRLGCTPAVNLFRKSAEPMTVNHSRHEYAVVPDKFRLNATEVYSIETVRGVSGVGKTRGIYHEYAPFYSTNHAETGKIREHYWHADRRSSNREDDDGTDMFLSFVNLSFDPESPMVETILVDTLCSNRDLPARLPFGESRDRSDFQVDKLASASVFCLTKPTPVRRLKLQRGVHWRVVSSLLVSVQGLLDPENGVGALREMLKLYDLANTPASQRLIQGVLSIVGRPVAAPVTGPQGEVGMARGTEVVLELDPEGFVGTSMVLFGAVLERFLAMQVSMSSFSKLSLKVRGREGYLKRWPPRSGNQPVL